jgi:hypothetical protein
MVNEELLQRSIYQYLRLQMPQYVTGITINFGESQLQDPDFTYPAIRVIITDQNPDGTGQDRLKLSKVYFIVRSYSERPSSYEANTLLGIARQRLFNKQITGTNLSNQPDHRIDRIDIANEKAAQRSGDRLWLAELYCVGLVTSYVEVTGY